MRCQLASRGYFLLSLVRPVQVVLGGVGLGDGGREPRQPAGRLEGGPEEAGAEAAHALHVAAAAGAGGALHEEPLPRHDHQGGDQPMDQPHRTESQGESPMVLPLVNRLTI